MEAGRGRLFAGHTRLALVGLGCLVFAGSASAATRYAAVGAAGTSPCPLATPCPLSTALSGAVTNDVVHVLPGTHVVAETVFTQMAAANVVIQGEGIGVSIVSYQPPVATANPAILLSGSTPTLRDLTVVGSANTFRLIAGIGVTAGPTVDRVALRNAGTGEALIVSGGATVRDSIITAAGTGVPALRLSGTMTGTTVVAGSGPAVEINGDFAAGANATIRNSILSGGSSDISVRTEASVQTAHVDVDYSAYRQTGGIVTGGNGSETTTIGTHNVFATPLLVNIAGGADVHQQPTSPTIDAGDPAAAAGSRGDIDGQPRIIGSAPDIGADEALTKPAVAMTAATNVTTTTATLNGTVNPAGIATTYRFEYGPTTAYGSASPDVMIPAGFTNAVATFDVTNFPAGSTIHARLVATNTAGTATSADAAITLTSPPPPPPPTPPTPPTPPEDAVPLIGPLSIVPASPTTGRIARLRFSLSEQARVTVTLDRLLNGRRRGTTCRVGATTGPRCVKVVRRATLVRVVASGTSATFVIPAKPGGTKLPTGRYRVRVTARDLVTGKVSVARTVVITVRA